MFLAECEVELHGTIVGLYRGASPSGPAQYWVQLDGPDGRTIINWFGRPGFIMSLYPHVGQIRAMLFSRVPEDPVGEGRVGGGTNTHESMGRLVCQGGLVFRQLPVLATRLCMHSSAPAKYSGILNVSQLHRLGCSQRPPLGTRVHVYCPLRL